VRRSPLVLLVLFLGACGPGHRQAGDSGAGGSGRGGMIQNKGSDTIVNLAQAWAEEYRKVRPDVAIAVSGGGSGTGIAALENGTVDIANASREIKAEERDLIVRNRGQQPVEHVVAYDGLAVFVHKDNPIERITRAQLAAVYGEHGKARKWADLGVTVPGCSGQQIVLVGRQNNSGTFDFFREWTVGKGDLKLGSRDMQGSKDVVDLVGTTPCAIGYSGLGYADEAVRMVCVATDDTTPCASPSVAAVLDKSYPISRALYMYTLGEPTGEVGSYVQWIQSEAGQAIVERSGFVPLPTESPAAPPAAPLPPPQPATTP